MSKVHHLMLEHAVDIIAPKLGLGVWQSAIGKAWSPVPGNRQQEIQKMMTIIEEMDSTRNILTDNIWSILQEVCDPEVPVLSVIDLGIIRDVKITKTGDEEKVEVIITPTYSGCPAMDVIRMNIRMVLLEHGYKNVQITTILSPAWTTDWMSEAGKEKLKAFGIAPPNPKQQVCNTQLFAEEEAIQCPHCNSYNTRRISEFGSTACKSLYQCNDCHEPFDYFKCH